MAQLLPKVVVPTLALGMAVSAAHAVLIRNVTNGTTIFNSHGLEYDTPGAAPVTSTGYWSNGNVSHDHVVDSGTPGAFEGSHYLATRRDPTAAGNARAFVTPSQTTAGDLIHAEWMMYVPHPHLADIGFALHNAVGANIGQVRIGGNGLGTLQDSWGGTIRSNAYQPNVWQKWEVAYTIGQSNYAVSVDEGTPFVATVPGGSTGFGHLSFFHNGNQTYYLDATLPSTPGQYEPQPQQSLRRMIDIDWSLGPRTPKGLQDSAVGVAHNTLLTVGGFNNGSGPGERGFHHETWGLNLANAGAAWQTLPAYPGSNNPSNVDGAGRQGFLTTVVNDELYAWGGFNYTSPATYADGYKLSKVADTWAWTPLPSLPTRRSGGGMVTVGSKIYAVGGADYDLTQSYTRTDRNGANPRYGGRIYVLDTADALPSWQELPMMPGTPRYVHATAAIGDKIYVIGGATGAHPSTHTVVDNWVFDTTNQTWSRIRDLPVASGNFPSGRIVFEDRYILLIGGYQYGAIENPDGTTRPIYGTPGKADPTNPFYNDIWVYDTQTDLFGTAIGMPLDNNLPSTVFFDGKLHLIGGETDGATIFGEQFAHHPDLYLIGTPKLALPGSHWGPDRSATWQRAGNWAGPMPNAPGDVANFAGAITTARTVFTDSPVTVGTLVFDNPNSYLLAGHGSITMETEEGGGAAMVEVKSGAHKINVPLIIASDTTMQVAAGAALKISDPLTVNAGTTLTQGGEGTVTYESTVKILAGGNVTFAGSAQLQALDLTSAATARLTPGGDKMLSVKQLLIAPSAALDVGDNDLLIDYAGASPFASVRQYLIDGLNHGVGGIVALAGDAGDTLALVDNQFLGRSEWNGQAIDESTIIGKYTYFGDANLDGAVTPEDYLVIDENFGMMLSAQWVHGDFTLDGSVTGVDYAAIDANLGRGTSDPLLYAELKASMIARHAELFGEPYLVALAAAEAGRFQVVPEPASAAMAAAALAGLSLRRRR